MSIQLTRKELHDMVWKRPVTKVAAELEISDVALHKICRKYNVPVPPRGYWAKLAAGKAVRQTSLPKGNEKQHDYIEIIGSPAKKLPQNVRDAQTQGLAHEASVAAFSDAHSSFVRGASVQKTVLTS